MSNVLSVRVARRNRNGVESWEGTVSLPGLQPTKLVRRADNTTSFSTRSALATSARSLATQLNYTGGVAFDEGTTQVKKAAKTRTRR